MTAEIAIINKQSIALAADSAVTVGAEKVWQYANKLFSLSPHNDLGIMIYGSGDFIGFPWETIVKCFRKKIGPHKFQTVEECAEKFIEYLESDEISDEAAEKFITFSICFDQLKRMKDSINTESADLDTEITKYSAAAIDAIKKEKEPVFSFDRGEIMETTKGGIQYVSKQFFGKELSDPTLEVVFDLCLEVCNREIESGVDTGVVIAGFGEKEYFPALRTYIVDGKFKGKVRAWKWLIADLNDPNDRHARIVPFAQDDMFYLFLHGFARENLSFVYSFIGEVLHSELKQTLEELISDPSKRAEAEQKATQRIDKVKDKFIEEFNEFRHKMFVGRIMDVVSSLPKEEMADMAEALVELTSLRRKVDSNIQTVGGPIDVAIISKGDGFIWKQRKHYFDIELNRDFMLRKQFQLEGGEA